MNAVATPTRKTLHTSPESCPFCRVWETEGPADAMVTVVSDSYPVTPGHRLVIPRRHEADLFNLSVEEYMAMWAAARRCADEIAAADPTIDGFNLGVNVGSAAGQTVGHVHLHVIPRREGDSSDPRGGVRWVVAETAAYWDR